MRRILHSACAFLLLAISTCVWSAAAWAQASDFYKGKTIYLLIGFPPGGTYDLYARLAAQYYGRYIPGNPSIIVQSKPGGSGIVAVNYFIANAPKDGTMIALFPETLAIAQLTEPQLSKWNVLDFRYIGSFADANGVFVLRKDAPAQTIDQMRQTVTHVGCNGRTGASYINPALLKAYADMKFELSCGYPGSNEISIALSRGEIDMTAGVWTGWRSRAQILDGSVRPVIQSGLKRHKELKDVPLMQEIITDKKKAEVAAFLSAGAAIGRALLAPAAVPPERIAVLRASFDKMVADPQFIADTLKTGLEIDPTSGEELDKISAAILQTPKDTVQLAIEISK